MDNIQKVMDVEQKALKIVADAHKKAEIILEKARKESMDARVKLDKSLEDKQNNRIRAAERDFAKKKTEIIKKGETDRKKLNIKASKNMNKAVDFVIDSLKKVN